MNTFTDIIEAFGGPAEFGRAIGIKPGHAGSMKTRDSIPDEYWLATVGAAELREIDGVTLEVLASISAKRREAAA